MRIKEALAKARDELKTNPLIDNPYKEAGILLSAFLDESRAHLLLNEDKKLLHVEKFQEWIKRRVQNEPLEYISQKVSFYSREFFIESGVLIPRPETELLVDLVYKKIESMKEPKVLEIGVGSGIISVVLALLHPHVRICATDINEKALHVAKKNAQKFGVSDRIEFFNCSYESSVSGEFDVLVSNPPYIKNGFPLDEHVLKEPHNALFGGERGHEMLSELVLKAKKRGIKTLACEMGYDQKEIMEQILVQNGVKEYEFYKDLSSLDRGFIAKF